MCSCVANAQIQFRLDSPFCPPSTLPRENLRAVSIGEMFVNSTRVSADVSNSVSVSVRAKITAGGCGRAL